MLRRAQTSSTPGALTVAAALAELVAVSVTWNVGYTGHTGLTVVRGDSTVTVALCPVSVELPDGPGR